MEIRAIGLVFYLSSNNCSIDDIVSLACKFSTTGKNTDHEPYPGSPDGFFLHSLH